MHTVTMKNRCDRECSGKCINPAIHPRRNLPTYLRHWAQFPRANSRILFCLVLSLMSVGPVYGQNAIVPDASGSSFENPSRQYLLRDWGGERTKLAEKGITFDFFYISDMQAKPSGGLQQTQAGWERIRGTVDVLARAQFSRHRTLAIGSEPGRQDWHPG